MNSDYWEARYQSADMPWEKGEPSPGLVDFLAANPAWARGQICVPGCGSGNDVRELARAGGDVFGFDFAPSAIASAIEKTKAAGLRARFQQSDFLRDEPPQRFDRLFEHTLFCAIAPEERDDYVRAVLRWLKPDGEFLAVNYFDCGPEGPPWPTTRDEQLERFSPHFNLVADWTPRSYPNREGREHMFHWRRKAV